MYIYVYWYYQKYSVVVQVLQSTTYDLLENLYYGT
jgi:hypothetical protein